MTALPRSALSPVGETAPPAHADLVVSLEPQVEAPPEPATPDGGLPDGEGASSPADADAGGAATRPGRWNPWRSLRHAPLSLKLGVALLGLYVLAALVSLVWTPYDPESPGAGLPYSPPSAEHWFGTDRLGSDVFSRTLAATRLDVGITLAAVLLALAIGSVLGTVAGYYRGVADGVIMRILEIFQAFPSLLFAMLIVQALGPGTLNVVAVLAFVGLPYYLRLARAEILSKRSWQFAEAARMVGGRSWRVAFRHLLPNSTGPLLAYTSVNAAWVVLITASLGFLGIGIEPGVPEWGTMISRGQDAIVSGEWWISFFPGLAVLGLAGAFYLLGDGLSDAADPRRAR